MILSGHLYLTGFRGTGKTTVGVILADALQLPLIDLDQRIEQRAGQSIREIFTAGGEQAFRELESAELQQVAISPRSVVSLGGGAILRDHNRQRIRTSGTCVWLDAAPAELAQRINRDPTTGANRPALTTMDQLQEIQHLLAVRKPLYQDAADKRVETDDKSVQAVAAEILQWLASNPSTDVENSV